MLKVPQGSFQEGFYIWFNNGKREEYYATSLYLYGVKRDTDYDNRRITLSLEKDISKVKPKKKEVAYKYPGLIYFPHVEKFGTMLLRFLNADFSTFEGAYNTFFYAYGYELIREHVPINCLHKSEESEVELIDILKRVFENSQYDLREMQENFRKFVDFVFNIDDNEEYRNYTANAMFVGYVIKNSNEIYKYSNKIEIIKDNYSSKDHEFEKESLQSLIKKMNENSYFVPDTNIYTSKSLSNILYVILEELTKTENNPIKKCKNCEKYFIPAKRLDEVYCEYPNEKGLTCKDIGAGQTYKKNLENIPALLEYRRSYQKKIMISSRNKEDKAYKKEFEKWKKEAQAKIKLYKQGKLAENELYEWMVENK